MAPKRQACRPRPSFAAAAEAAMRVRILLPMPRHLDSSHESSRLASRRRAMHERRADVE